MGLISNDEDCISGLTGERIPHNCVNPKKLRRQYRQELRGLKGFSVFSSAEDAEKYEKNQSESQELDISGISVLITSN